MQNISSLALIVRELLKKKLRQKSAIINKILAIFQPHLSSYTKIKKYGQ